MNTNSTKNPKDSTISNLVFGILILSGFLLISISIIIEPTGNLFFSKEFLKEILKELGIVVLSVFTISLIYEKIVSKKYYTNFLNNLRLQIAQGESNGAVCENLGIREIFKTRAKFEMSYPLDKTLSQINVHSKVRIIAVSMFLIMSKADLLKKAIKEGCKIELAIFNPQIPSQNLQKIQELEVSDIETTISIFKKNIIEWINIEKPKGKVELRFHGITLLDSFSTFKTTANNFGAWDLSFGRDTTRKRTLIINMHKPIGKDLRRRYKRIWQCSESVFKYNGKKVKLDNLTT